MPKLALITGASSGIGLEIARCAAKDGYDLLIVSEDGQIEDAAGFLRAEGATVETATIDLGTEEGVDELWGRLGGRPLDVLVANAGFGMGHRFVDQSWDAVRATIGTNVTGTVQLLHLALPRMLERGEGRILVTGSIAGYMPGAFLAVYSATKAFVDSLCFAIREEIKDSPVTITCLMPGATETAFFDKADNRDSMIGRSPKDEPSDVARQGWEAMKRGQSNHVPGLMNKLMVAAAGVLPEELVAKLSRWQQETDEDKAREKARAAS